MRVVIHQATLCSYSVSVDNVWWLIDRKQCIMFKSDTNVLVLVN